MRTQQLNAEHEKSQKRRSEHGAALQAITDAARIEFSVAKTELEELKSRVAAQELNTGIGEHFAATAAANGLQEESTTFSAPLGGGAGGRMPELM